jgi:hypothetical protein
MRNRVHDLPIDGLVAIHGNVAKADGALHPLAQERCYHACCGQQFERFAHRLRCWLVSVSEDVSRQVYTQLHGAGYVQAKNVLPIGIGAQSFRCRSPTLLDPLRAAAKRLQLFGND